jgi:hypothetical protein
VIKFHVSAIPEEANAGNLLRAVGKAIEGWKRIVRTEVMSRRDWPDSDRERRPITLSAMNRRK